MGFLFNLTFLSNLSSSETYEDIEKAVVYKRLLCFLRVFAVLDGPKQLVHHQLLEKVYRSFLSHQDDEVAQLALSCLLKYKTQYLLPYSSFLNEILKKGQLREALLNFAEKFKAGDVAELHREALLPLISRILFGRLSVKGKRSSKDSPVARRAAILSFLSVVCKDESEIFPFVYLMTRHFLPRKQRLIPIEAASQNDRQNAMDLLMSIGLEDLAVLPSGVIEGFLHLLETVVSQLGHRIISFVPQFTSIVLALCTMAADGRNKEARVEDGTDASTRGLVYRYSSIRSLGYQQLSEIFGRFCMTVDFSSFARPTWRALDRSVELLPEMVMKTEKAPAILVLLETMSTDWRLIKILAMHDAAVQSVVKCIAGTSLVSVMNSSLTFVENLLTVRDPTSSSESKTTGLRLIRKYIPLLMEQFTLRLKNGSDYDGDKGPAKGKHWSKPGHPHTTWRRELDILCRVSELLSNEDGDRLKDKSSVLASLFSLLLPFLKPDRMTSDDDKLNIVGILKSTMPQLEKENMAEIFASISGILAPSKGKPGIKSRLIRHAIASLVGAIAKVDGQFRLIADKLVKLNAMHAKRVDEMDFEVVIPALNSLSQSGGDGTWLSLCGEDDPSPSILNPLISTCFHFLHNDDGVILRVSFNALRTLIRLAAEKATDDTASVWAKLVESAVVPLTRSGLQSRDPSVRRHYILLVKEISRSFQTHSSPNLCGDLHTLIDDENPDLDFFMNITHVQIHRRSRAFQRLRKVLSEAVNETNVSPFCLQSLSNVLLPIAMHPIYECRTIAEETFALEAIATVGSISRLLSWSKYNNMLWTMLTHFERYPEQERFLIGAICAVIDGFGYELTVSDGDDKQITKDEGGDDDTKTAVWRSLERRMIPKIEGLLTKETTDRSGSRKKTIRPTIILALLKLFQKFPEHFFESKLPHLLSVICDALRSKDSNARDVARKTMAKMVVSMDLKYLADVLREVAITLTEGYRLHVRAAVVHTVLQELSNSYKPSSVDSSTPLYFDDCTAALMELIQEDLFGEANERRESKETNVRFVKEAGGSKSLDSIELICRMVNFKPLDAGNNGPNRSSVHCVVSPLLERLRSPDVETATIRKIRLILTRVVVGLSHNSSVRADQLFPFVYATVEPFIGAQAIAAAQNSRNDDDDDDDDMDDALRPIQISGARDAKKGKEAPRKGKVVEWRPSTLKAAESSKAALESKRDEKNELRKVRDGASAPKLTGSSRHDTSNMSSHQGLNDLGSISAVVFGLNLLNSCLKKLDLVDKSLPAMMDPFVPLLTACVCFCRESDVALVGLKCLMSFLRFDLPSIPSCSESLGTQALAFLTSSGSSLNQNPDLTQACFRTLTYLIKSDEGAGVGGNKDKNILVDGEHVLTKNSKMPLNAEQMKVLISTLQLSVAESDQHNPALGLIKAILARRYTSPELYDLMEAMLKLVVRSHTAALRQVCNRME
jgi:U3 small nucleolar RNA-associated protein 20